MVLIESALLIASEWNTPNESLELLGDRNELC